jgi:hypothetical protein
VGPGSCSVHRSGEVVPFGTDGQHPAVMSTKRKRPARPDRPAPRIRELMDRGWHRRDAEHLGVLELGLSTVVAMPPRARHVLAEHVATALKWEPVRCAAAQLYCEPEHAEAWRALAASGPSWGADLMSRLAAESEGADLLALEPDDPRLLPTPEELWQLDEVHRAVARGDFDDAVTRLSAMTRPSPDRWRVELELMRAQGDELTPAQWGRFVCGAAWSWGIGTVQGMDLAVHYARVVLEALGAPADVVERDAPWRLVYDQLVHDAVLFDSGLLDGYLTQELGPRVAARVPGLSSWVLAAPTVCELAGPVDGGALVRDLRRGEDLVVGDAGLGEDHPSGRLFYGRLVRVEGDDRAFFATLPTILDDIDAARAVVEALERGCTAEERLAALHRSLRDGYVAALDRRAS